MATGAAPTTRMPPLLAPRLRQPQRLPPARRARVACASAEALAALGAPPGWLGRDGEQVPASLRGNHAPVVGEIDALACRVVRGELPASLDGVFLRNGPNARHEPLLGTGEYHAFDGDGMVHYVALHGGRAEYGRRYVRTRGFEAEERAGAAEFTGMRNLMPLPDVFPGRLAHKLANAARPETPWWVVQTKNQANNGITSHAGRLLATWEAGSAYELVPDRSLASRGLCDFGGTNSTLDFWKYNFSAHPKVCATTGEMVFLGYGLVGAPLVSLGSVCGDTGRILGRRDISNARPSMQHDHAITESRVVLMEQPLVFQFGKTLAGGRPFDFEAGGTVRYGIVPRRGSLRGRAGEEADEEVVWIEEEGSSSYSYHVLNAYDDPADGDRVVLYVHRMDSTRGLGMADVVAGAGAEAGGGEREILDAAPGGQPEVARLHRVVLDVARARVVSSERVCELPSDFPCVSPRVVGQPFKYGYSVLYDPDYLRERGEEMPDDEEVPNFVAVLKHDVAEGVTHRFDLGDGRVCGDIIFVPREDCEVGAREEDDGHLLVLAHRGERHMEGADLLVVCARTLTCVAEVEIPVRVPFGFHCGWHAGAGRW